MQTAPPGSVPGPSQTRVARRKTTTRFLQSIYRGSWNASPPGSSFYDKNSSWSGQKARVADLQNRLLALVPKLRGCLSLGMFIAAWPTSITIPASQSTQISTQVQYRGRSELREQAPGPRAKTPFFPFQALFKLFVPPAQPAFPSGASNGFCQRRGA